MDNQRGSQSTKLIKHVLMSCVRYRMAILFIFIYALTYPYQHLKKAGNNTKAIFGMVYKNGQVALLGGDRQQARRRVC